MRRYLVPLLFAEVHRILKQLSLLRLQCAQFALHLLDLEFALQQLRVGMFRSTARTANADACGIIIILATAVTDAAAQTPASRTNQRQWRVIHGEEMVS
jgi:hypothetical protein